MDYPPEAMAQSNAECRRLRDALATLLDATTLTWGTSTDPGTALLTESDDLDWSLTASYLQAVLAGDTAERALEHVQHLLDTDDLTVYTGPPGYETVIDANSGHPIRVVRAPTEPQEAPQGPPAPKG